MVTSEAQEIKKQETLVRFSIISYKTRLRVGLKTQFLWVKLTPILGLHIYLVIYLNDYINHLYLIADGCAEDIISVSLLSNAFKSSQATCSNDILQYRFYNVAEQ